MKKNNNKNGVSLIVLVVTVLVIVILAAIVISQFGKNNPFTESRKSVFVGNIRSYIDELNTYLSEQITNSTYDTTKEKPTKITNANIYLDDSKIGENIGKKESTVNDAGETIEIRVVKDNDITKYVPDFDEKIYGGVIYIENSEFVYYKNIDDHKDKNVNYKLWLTELGISEGHLEKEYN